MTNSQSSLLWNSVIRYPDFQHHYFGQMSLSDDKERPFLLLLTAGILVFFLFGSIFRPQNKHIYFTFLLVDLFKFLIFKTLQINKV